MAEPAELVTVKLSVWFEGMPSMDDSAIEEVREVLLDALRGTCKPAFEAALEKINAKNIQIQFIAF